MSAIASPKAARQASPLFRYPSQPSDVTSRAQPPPRAFQAALCAGPIRQVALIQGSTSAFSSSLLNAASVVERSFRSVQKTARRSSPANFPLSSHATAGFRASFLSAKAPTRAANGLFARRSSSATSSLRFPKAPKPSAPHTASTAAFISLRSSAVAFPPGSISPSRNGRSFRSRNPAQVSRALFVRMFSLQSRSQASSVPVRPVRVSASAFLFWMSSQLCLEIRASMAIWPSSWPRNSRAFGSTSAGNFAAAARARIAFSPPRASSPSLRPSSKSALSSASPVFVFASSRCLAPIFSMKPLNNARASA